MHNQCDKMNYVKPFQVLAIRLEETAVVINDELTLMKAFRQSSPDFYTLSVAVELERKINAANAVIDRMATYYSIILNICKMLVHDYVITGDSYNIEPTDSHYAPFYELFNEHNSNPLFTIDFIDPMIKHLCLSYLNNVTAAHALYPSMRLSSNDATLTITYLKSMCEAGLPKISNLSSGLAHCDQDTLLCDDSHINSSDKAIIDQLAFGISIDVESSCQSPHEIPSLESPLGSPSEPSSRSQSPLSPISPASSGSQSPLSSGSQSPASSHYDFDMPFDLACDVNGIPECMLDAIDPEYIPDIIHSADYTSLSKVNTLTFNRCSTDVIPDFLL